MELPNGQFAPSNSTALLFALTRALLEDGALTKKSVRIALRKFAEMSEHHIDSIAYKRHKNLTDEEGECSLILIVLGAMVDEGAYARVVKLAAQHEAVNNVDTTGDPN